MGRPGTRARHSPAPQGAALAIGKLPKQARRRHAGRPGSWARHWAGGRPRGSRTRRPARMAPPSHVARPGWRARLPGAGEGGPPLSGAPAKVARHSHLGELPRPPRQPPLGSMRCRSEGASLPRPLGGWASPAPVSGEAGGRGFPGANLRVEGEGPPPRQSPGEGSASPASMSGRGAGPPGRASPAPTPGRGAGGSLGFARANLRRPRRARGAGPPAPIAGKRRRGRRASPASISGRTGGGRPASPALISGRGGRASDLPGASRPKSEGSPPGRANAILQEGAGRAGPLGANPRKEGGAWPGQRQSAALRCGGRGAPGANPRAGGEGPSRANLRRGGSASLASTSGRRARAFPAPPTPGPTGGRQLSPAPISGGPKGAGRRASPAPIAGQRRGRRASPAPIPGRAGGGGGALGLPGVKLRERWEGAGPPRRHFPGGTVSAGPRQRQSPGGGGWRRASPASTPGRRGAGPRQRQSPAPAPGFSPGPQLGPGPRVRARASAPGVGPGPGPQAPRRRAPRAWRPPAHRPLRRPWGQGLQKHPDPWCKANGRGRGPGAEVRGPRVGAGARRWTAGGQRKENSYVFKRKVFGFWASGSAASTGDKHWGQAKHWGQHWGQAKHPC